MTGVDTKMVFIETSIFIRQVLELLTDEQYRELQRALVNRPDSGALIVGSGGLRKGGGLKKAGAKEVESGSSTTGPCRQSKS